MNFANLSFTLLAMYKLLYQIYIYTNKSTTHQRNHNSSITAENTKSPCTSGKYPNFWIEPQNHFHLKPPLQIAINACFV
ncbi:MAG: hypothetical protein LBC61_04330 [Candidatus Peribacteria bacterium]|nr:hypothetical protein [Candidatus Peribacteria bacterium]